MKSQVKPGRAAASVVVSVAMVFSMTLAPAFASAKDASNDRPDVTMLTTASDDNGVPEWAIDDGQDEGVGLGVQAELPAAYDLRDEGLVTPVKFQNPWNSCWAFGGLAAAETSILSAYGTTYAESGLDLSERHLAYFALHPVTASVNPSQVGEGAYTLDESPNAALDTGGKGIYITTLFSQGVGPVAESAYPYRGNNAITTPQYYEQHPDVFKAEVESQIMALAKQYGASANADYDTCLAVLANKLKDMGRIGSADEAYGYIEKRLTDQAEANLTYSKYDDWTIPELNENGKPNRLVSGGVVLKNGNVLPTYWQGGKDEPNVDSQRAIKQELVNGHGVSITYYADQSSVYTKSDEGAANAYNQYVPTPYGADHYVCIVGWDDAYSKDNFASPAPGDGAWIVKNSWGSTADAGYDDLGNYVNHNEHGIKNEKGEFTGYFYLSYYDRTIDQPETMEFSANLGTGGTFCTMQHDYMPASAGFYTVPSAGDVVSSANVFQADEALELKSVSTRTSEENMRVTFAIYALNDNAADPTDGAMIYRTSCNFEYGGFHRLDLDRAIPVAKGQRFSVVSTVSMLDGQGNRSYSASANEGITKAKAEMGKEQGINVKIYNDAVVNEGESFLYSDGAWQDWSAYLASSDLGTKGMLVDNFSIKVYADAPAGEAQAQVVEARAAAIIAQARATAAEAAQKAAETKAAEAEQAKKEAEARASAAQDNVTAAQDNVTAAQKAQKEAEKKAAAAEKKAAAAEKKAASFYKANPMKVKAKTVAAKAKATKKIARAKAFTVTGAKGKVTFYKLSGTSKATVSKTGVVTVKKGLKKGKTYSVKVLVLAAGDKQYAPSVKIVTLRVKVS